MNQVKDGVKPEYFLISRTLREVSETNEESPLKSELQPWSRGTWDQLGVKTTRVGLIARKIGVIPMWYKNGRPCDVTMLHVRSCYKKCLISSPENADIVCYYCRVFSNAHIFEFCTVSSI